MALRPDPGPSRRPYRYAERGAETAVDPHGTVGLWLLGLQARSAAILGDAETVRVAKEQEPSRPRDGRAPDRVFCCALGQAPGYRGSFITAVCEEIDCFHFAIIGSEQCAQIRSRHLSDPVWKIPMSQAQEGV